MDHAASCCVAKERPCWNWQYRSQLCSCGSSGSCGSCSDGDTNVDGPSVAEKTSHCDIFPFMASNVSASRTAYESACEESRTAENLIGPAGKERAMITFTTPLCRRLILSTPLLITGLWLFSQKGCVPEPDISSLPASAYARSQPSHTTDFPLAHQSIAPSSRATSQSLKRAAALLRHAADILDKDERLAMRFIRQAIAILKRVIIPGINAPDHDRVFMPSGPLPEDAL